MVPVNLAAKRAETITTSLGQQVDATVEKFRDSSLRFDQLVTAINEAELLLGVPFPSPEVTMTHVEHLPGGFCGYNQVSYAPGFAGDPYVVEGSLISVRSDEYCDDTFAVIAHEVAHTWFHNSLEKSNWIDEGLANAVELQVVKANRPHETIYPPVTYCEDYRNILELELAAPARANSDQNTGFICNYTIGDGIFGALRQHYGQRAFNERIALLARRSVNRTGREHSIEDVRRILGGDPISVAIIDTWYEGSPQMRKFQHLDAVEWTIPPIIDGELLYFAGIIDESGAVHDFVMGDHPYCSQFSLYQGIGDVDWVDSVSGPLPAGWTHDEDTSLVTLNHQINPRTGEFRVTAKFLDTPPISIPDLSLAVESRVTTGVDGFCSDSTTFSQVLVHFGRIPAEFKPSRFYHLDVVKWTFPPTTDGEYLYFAGRTIEPGLVHTFVLGKDPFCSQFTLYRNVINQEWVASIRDPLPVGWKHNEVPEIVVVNDRINPATGEFAVTARFNNPYLATIPELSLLVRGRAEADSTNTCPYSDTYSQALVVRGQIPSLVKVARHYHSDAIQWINPPSVTGNLLRFSGRAEPGAIDLEWREDYCSQFVFYEQDERGYHYIDSLNPFLPGDSYWTGPITGEVTNYRIGGDGTFEATARLSDNALFGYNNPVLMVRSKTAVDQKTNLCGESDVLSALDLR